MVILKDADLLLESFLVSFAKLIDLDAYTSLVRTPNGRSGVRAITKPPQKAADALVTS